MSKNALRNKKRREKQKEKKAAEASGSADDWSVLDLLLHSQPTSITQWKNDFFQSGDGDGYALIHVYTVWKSS